MTCPDPCRASAFHQEDGLHSPRGYGSRDKGASASLCAKDGHLQALVALQLHMPRVKLTLFTLQPAPSPNSSLLSTKSSLSCHPSLRPGGRASAVQSPHFTEDMRGGSKRLRPLPRPQLMQRRSWDKNEPRRPCSHRSRLCGQVLLCPVSA